MLRLEVLQLTLRMIKRVDHLRLLLILRHKIQGFSSPWILLIRSLEQLRRPNGLLARAVGLGGDWGYEVLRSAGGRVRRVLDCWGFRVLGGWLALELEVLALDWVWGWIVVHVMDLTRSRLICQWRRLSTSSSGSCWSIKMGWIVSFMVATGSVILFQWNSIFWSKRLLLISSLFIIFINFFFHSFFRHIRTLWTCWFWRSRAIKIKNKKITF